MHLIKSIKFPAIDTSVTPNSSPYKARPNATPSFIPSSMLRQANWNES